MKAIQVLTQVKAGLHPIDYFWKYILERNHWLNIFHHFVYIEKKKQS